MSFSFWTGLAALALLPAAAFARQGQPPHPADADAPVLHTSFVSAFTSYQPAADDMSSPDQVWRIANQAVGNAGAPSMQMAPHGAHRPDASLPDPHAGHGAHHRPQGQ